MQEKYLWLSYDLGLKGDYKNLYAWLDSHEAKECGDNLAYINKYSFQTNLFTEIKQDMEKTIQFSTTDRIYVITTGNNETGAIAGATGKFIIGRRRNTTPWTGFGSSDKGNIIQDGSTK